MKKQKLKTLREQSINEVQQTALLQLKGGEDHIIIIDEDAFRGDIVIVDLIAP